MRSDLFCAFQPKRAMVPSLPLWLNRPPMPSALRAAAVESRLACSAASEMFSSMPAPKIGVGMRRITLLRASSRAKSGCASVQSGASMRQAMVKSACTPPSGVPSGLRMKRASRIGPSRWMNEGTV